jgi:hypothetical protein
VTFFDPTRIARRMPHPRARPLTSPRITSCDETRQVVLRVPAICTLQQHELRCGAPGDPGRCFYCGQPFDADVR